MIWERGGIQRRVLDIREEGRGLQSSIVRENGKQKRQGEWDRKENIVWYKSTCPLTCVAADPVPL